MEVGPHTGDLPFAAALDAGSTGPTATSMPALTRAAGLDDLDGYSSFHDVDTSAEVDAAFRSQRRIAVAYFMLFVVVLAGVAVGTVASGWATSQGLPGGFSPSFLMTAVGLYLFFVAVGLAAASLANAVDDRMLGADSLPNPGPPGPVPLEPPGHAPS